MEIHRVELWQQSVSWRGRKCWNVSYGRHSVLSWVAFTSMPWYLRVVRPVFGNTDVLPNGEFELFWHGLNVFVAQWLI